MLPTRRLLQACRITLFTRQNCGLCVQARSVLSDVWDSRPFVFNEVDIIKPDSKGWRDLYEMDVPVVRLQRRGFEQNIGRQRLTRFAWPDSHRQGDLSRGAARQGVQRSEAHASIHGRRGQV